MNLKLFRLMCRRPLKAFSEIKSPKRFYKDFPTLTLLNTYMIFYFSQYNIFVDNMEKITSIGSKIGGSLFFKLLKATMGKQFTAGENFEEVVPIVRELSRRGFHIAVNYMAEFDKSANNANQFALNVEKYVKAFSLKKDATNKEFFNAIKISALIDFDLLKKISKTQHYLDSIFFESLSETKGTDWTKTSKTSIHTIIKNKFPNELDEQIVTFLDKVPFNFSTNKDEISLIEWRLNCACFNLVNPKISEDHMFLKLVNYTEKEKLEIFEFTGRLNKIILEAKNTSSYILVDAEQTYLQDAINSFVEQLIYLNNLSNGNPVIFHTVQNYLLVSKEYIDYEVSKTRFFEGKYPIAMKLVRGAYLSEEKEITKITGIKTVFDRKNETDESYDTNCLKIVNNLDERSKLIVATHNDESLRIIVKEIDAKENLRIRKNNVYFATLLGLNDPLAFKSLEQGLQSIKYLPYGEKEIILPYLIRRGQESKSLIQNNHEQLSIIKNELKIRFFENFK